MELVKQVATYLAAQGLGTLSTDIFYSYFPDNIDNCLAVIDTGGMEPDIYLPTKSPTFQILIRGVDYNTGKAKLNIVRSLLHQKKGVYLVVGQNFFFYIHALSEGGHIGRNKRGLDEFSINFQAKIR